jgi:hypothetical protein
MRMEEQEEEAEECYVAPLSCEVDRLGYTGDWWSRACKIQKAEGIQQYIATLRGCRYVSEGIGQVRSLIATTLPERLSNDM